MNEQFLYSFIQNLPENDATNMLSANSYCELLKKKKYIKFTDLDDQKALERYNKLMTFISKKPLKIYKFDDFEDYDEEFIFETFTEVIISIFGCNDKIVDEIKSFIQNIRYKESDEILDGYSIQMLNKVTGNIEYSILIPSIRNLSAIVCLSHEFIHYHLQSNNLENKIFQYGEILSIYAEKIATHIVEEKKLDLDITKKIENVRLDGVVWHNVTNKQEVRNAVKLYSSIQGMDKNIQDIKEIFFNYKKYSIALAQSYGIGYIYAENLYQMYLNDSKIATEKINNVLSGEDTLESILAYYNISTNNKETFENAKMKVRSIFK